MRGRPPESELIFTPNGPTTQTISITVIGSYLIKPTVGFTLNAFRPDTEECASAAGVIENQNSTVVTNTRATGYGSMFGAISSANQTPGPHNITFAIPSSAPVTIPIAAPLPALTNPATINLDATTQPGSTPLPRVTLDGSKAGTGAIGLNVEGGNTTIRGLGIQNFNGAGIELAGYGADSITGNTITNSGGAGVDVKTSGSVLTGNMIVGSGLSGVVLNSGTAKSVVNNNTIVGSKQSGILDNGGQGDLIAGNTLGKPGLGNLADGVTLNGAVNAQVGGILPGMGNLIQSNGFVGVRVNGPNGSGDVIEGNRIGVGSGVVTGRGVAGSAGTAGPSGQGNLFGGVFLDEATGVLVGGASLAARNFLSGNGGAGIEILDGGRNILQGNWLGLDSSGNAAAGNALDGIYLLDTSNNLVGGTAANAGNVISGNGYVGVRIAGTTSTFNSLQGNRIGTNAAGTAALGNTYDGVFLTQGANHTFIGGTVAGAGNQISGNLATGIQLNDAGTSFNVIAGNLIGTNVNGLVALPNQSDGVFLNGVASNIVGLPNAGNLVSGNAGSGVQLFGAATVGNFVSANRIGLNAANQPTLGNAVGIFVNQAGKNTIGGTGASANVVAGNRFGQTLVTVPGVPIPIPVGNQAASRRTAVRVAKSKA